MRISDWSSDVCSSDLVILGLAGIAATRRDRDVAAIALVEGAGVLPHVGEHLDDAVLMIADRRARRIGQVRRIVEVADIGIDAVRSEERRVGKECVSTCRYRWSPYH